MKLVTRIHPDFPSEKLRPFLAELKRDLRGVRGRSWEATEERTVIRESIANVEAEIRRRGL